LGFIVQFKEAKQYIIKYKYYRSITSQKRFKKLQETKERHATICQIYTESYFIFNSMIGVQGLFPYMMIMITLLKTFNLLKYV